MNVWIVGIDHELQFTPDSTDTDKRRALKNQLKGILTVGIPQRPELYSPTRQCNQSS
jgi:hypothetical protein